MVQPTFGEVFKECSNLKPYIFDNGYECLCFGYFDYEGNIYPIYSDDYGCQDFIVYRYHDKNNQIKEYAIPVQNIGGILDWTFELDRMKNEYPNEIISTLKDFE